MANLLITIMAVALAAFVLASGAWYIDTRVGPTNEIKLKSMAGMTSLAAGYRAFNMSDTQILPETSWKTSLGSYVTVPQPPGSGLEWIYDCNNDYAVEVATCAPGVRHGFCLFGASASEVQFTGMKRARSQMSSSQVDIGSSCGAGTYNSTDPASFSTPVALTYWLTN